MEGQLPDLEGQRVQADKQMVYASPSVNEMLSQKGSDLEGKDFFDFVFGK